MEKGFRSSYAYVNQIRLHYVAMGDGPLMIFLHGFPEFWYGWRNQLLEFGKDHLCVAPDLRGYNLSDKPPDVEQYAMKNMVEDVGALAVHLGHKHFTLVGHDWGGAIAWAFAIEHPEYLHKLVIVNGPHPGVFDQLLRQDPGQQQASAYMLMFRNETAEQTLTADNYALLTRIVFAARMRRGALTDEDERDKKAYLEAWSHPGAITGGPNYYRAARMGPPDASGNGACGNFAVDPSKLRVDVPTLVIWAEQDLALPLSNLDGLDEYVPQLTVRRIPGASHWVIHEQPDEVNWYIREFIAS